MLDGTFEVGTGILVVLYTPFHFLAFTGAHG